MKIISSYKDYYDYLVGIYGIDPLIVLDRRNFDLPIYLNSHFTDDYCFYKLIIGEYLIDFMVDNENNFYFGKEILNLKGIKEYHNKFTLDFINKHYNSNNAIKLKIFKRIIEFSIKPIKIERSFEKNIVIGILNNRNNEFLYKYPILKNINVNKFINADKIYQMIYDYLTKLNLEKENIVDNRSDIEKLTSKGFDKKESFRKTK